MNNKTLPEKHQWFLDAAVTTKIPLPGLLDKEIFYDDGHLQNMPYHDFAESEIAAIVAELCAEEFIEVIDYERSDELEEDVIHRRPAHSITTAAVEALLHIEVAEGENIWAKMSYYRLTSKGGAYWESLAQPNWHDFVVRRVVGPWLSPGSDEVEVVVEPWQQGIAGLTESVIRETMQIHNTTPIEGSEEWCVLAPWEATYWKIFPQGRQVIYRYSSPRSFVGETFDYESVAATLAKNKQMMESERYQVLYGRRWYRSPWHI